MGKHMNVTVIASGGIPITQVASGAPIAYVLTTGGAPVTVTTGATPFVLLTPDGNQWVGP
jgi:hypothetical protein